MKKIFQIIFIVGIIALFFSLAMGAFAMDENIVNSLNTLLGSTSTDQSTPASTGPDQPTVKPDFAKIVVGDAKDNYIFLGDNEISGIDTTRQVGFGVQTAGELGSFIGLNSNTGMVIENSDYLGLMGISTASSGGVGIKVSDATDIGIYANGESIGFYSQGTTNGLNITTTGYGGVLGSSVDGTGVIGIGTSSGNGVKFSDGSYLGGSGIGLFANGDAFIGENYATFTIKNDATLADLNTTDLYVSQDASFKIFDAENAKAKNGEITLVGSLDMDNDLSVTKGVTIVGPTSGSNSIGGNLLFSDYTNDIKIGPDKDAQFGIADDVSIDGNMYVENDLTANEMGNITIHDQTATGSNPTAQVACDSQQTIMGCGASITSGSADITEVYPSADGSCYAKSLGSSSTLHVYAYCFEPNGDGTGSETPPPVKNPCDDPTDCGVIDIKFDTGNDWLWNWEVACNPPCKSSDTSFTNVTADCGGTEQGCPGSKQNGGDITDNILTESGSYLLGWAGVNEHGNAFGNMTTAGLAYMLQTGKLSDSQIADMDTDQVDAALELLENNNYGVDGQLQSGAYAELDALVNSIANIRTNGNVNIPGNIQP